MTSSPRILLVEDNPADAQLTKRLFQKVAGLREDHIHVVEDGRVALGFMGRTPPPGERRLPDLLVVDLNLPVLSGLDLIAAVREDPAAGHLPIIILSSSAAPHDVQRANALHVSAYLRKPVDLPSYRALIEVVDRYWLRTTELPRHA